MQQNSNIDLEKAQLTLNSVLDAIGNDFIVVDTQGQITFINLKAKTNLFINIADSTKNFRELIEKFSLNFTIENSDQFFDLINRTSDPNSFIAEKLKIHLKQSIQKGYEILTSPIYNASVGHLGRIWQFRDITIHENIDNIKSEFISIASHQLRTPLTSIRGYVDMVLAGDYGVVNPEIIEPLKYVEKASAEMAALINDLLSISRLDKSAEEATYTEFNLDDLMTELTEMFKNKVGEKNITYEYTTFQNGVQLKTDRDKLREAIKNLIDNAVKYSLANGKVRIEATSPSQNVLRIAVSDTGVGIPDDQQDRIFEKFFRAANVLTENFDGTGLGLYYVKEAIEKIGGSVSFKSKVNEGSTFTIEIPMI